jgi:hypothetical protein
MDTSAFGSAMKATTFKYFTAPASYGTDPSVLGQNWATLGRQLNYTAFPWLTIAGYSTVLHQDLVEFTTSSNYTLSGSLTKIAGRHTLRPGGEGRLLLFNTAQTNYGTGSLVFSRAGTGDAFASFLLGLPLGGTSSQIATFAALATFNRYHGYYITDTFQASPKLTLTDGLRWELPGSEGEKRNRDTIFLPNAADPLAGASSLPLKGRLALVNTPEYPSRYETALHYMLFSPRAGFSWRMTSDSVLRGGYGLSYLPIENWIGYGPPASPINTAVTYLSANATLSNAFPSGVNKPAARSPGFMSALEGGQLSSTSPNQPYPYSQQWNIGVRQQFGSQTLLDIAYAGTKGTHLSNAVNINQLPDSYDTMGPQLLQTRRIRLPRWCLPQALCIPALRQFANISISNLPAFDTFYHSLQVQVQKRFASSVKLLVASTWSKDIGQYRYVDWVSRDKSGRWHSRLHQPEGRSLPDEL